MFSKPFVIYSTPSLFVVNWSCTCGWVFLAIYELGRGGLQLEKKSINVFQNLDIDCDFLIVTVLLFHQKYSFDQRRAKILMALRFREWVIVVRFTISVLWWSGLHDWCCQHLNQNFLSMNDTMQFYPTLPSQRRILPYRVVYCFLHCKKNRYTTFSYYVCLC